MPPTWIISIAAPGWAKVKASEFSPAASAPAGSDTDTICHPALSATAAELLPCAAIFTDEGLGERSERCTTLADACAAFSGTSNVAAVATSATFLPSSVARSFHAAGGRPKRMYFAIPAPPAGMNSPPRRCRWPSGRLSTSEKTPWRSAWATESEAKKSDPKRRPVARIIGDESLVERGAVDYFSSSGCSAFAAHAWQVSIQGICCKWSTGRPSPQVMHRP